MGQDSTKSFTSMPSNTLVRMLVEKGIVGTSLYVLFLLAVVRVLWQRRKRRESRIIGCTLLALFAKDMSQSAWGEIPFLMLEVYLLLAYLQREKEENPERIPFSASSYTIAGFSLAALHGTEIFRQPDGAVCAFFVNLVHVGFSTDAAHDLNDQTEADEVGFRLLYRPEVSDKTFLVGRTKCI